MGRMAGDACPGYLPGLQWLADTHAAPDAVAAAYGWEAGIGEEEALEALLELNSAAKPASGS